MKELPIDREFGRIAFGADPAAYHAARPPYPEWVYDVLRERCGLADGTATFEVGAGTGIATRRLIELGANPLVAIEPDSRMAAFLRAYLVEEALKVVAQTFEEVELETISFDLGVSATAFHWLDEDLALKKAAGLIKPGGWWAMVWNVFGDDSRPDPFHDATYGLLHGHSSPSDGRGGISFGLDFESRLAALSRTGAFSSAEYLTSEWSLVLDPDQTVALYATYSNVNIRQDRDVVLKELGRVAREEFQGQVTRNMVTSLFIAQRGGSL